MHLKKKKKKNCVYVKVIKVGKGLEWGVKAIIWEEKKNDLSSGCQQRKRLCIKKRGAGQRQVWASPECREVRGGAPHSDHRSAYLEPTQQWPCLCSHIKQPPTEKKSEQKHQRDDVYSPSECREPCNILCSHVCSESQTQEGVIITPVLQRWKLSHCLDVLPKPHNLQVVG